MRLSDRLREEFPSYAHYLFDSAGDPNFFAELAVEALAVKDAREVLLCENEEQRRYIELLESRLESAADGLNELVGD